MGSVAREVAFYDIAKDQAHFYLSVSESIQQRSVGMLGFAGILVGLVPLLMPLASRSSDGLRWLGAALAIFGVVALLVSIWFAVASIFTRTVEYPRTSAILGLLDEGVSTSSEVYGNWAKTLLQSTVPTFQEEARYRTEMFKASVVFLAVGASLITMSLATLILGVIL